MSYDTDSSGDVSGKDKISLHFLTDADLQAELNRRALEREESVSGYVAKRREMLGLTRDELASAIGMSPATIKLMEEGRHDFRLSTITKLAEALDVGSLDLLTNADGKTRPTS